MQVNNIKSIIKGFKTLVLRVKVVFCIQDTVLKLYFITNYILGDSVLCSYTLDVLLFAE